MEDGRRYPVGELYPTEPSWPPRMRINLPRHDLLGEERLTSLSEEKGLETLLLGLVCIGIQGIYVELINHCQAVMIKE